MVFGSREMVSGHRSMVLPGSDMPSALGLVSFVTSSETDFVYLTDLSIQNITSS